MKKEINALIVVEGKTDIALLSSFIEADFYSVNGSAVNENDINYLKQVERTKSIIILTDPDFPGEKIRNYLNEHLNNPMHAYVDKNKAIKKGKLGVAETDKDEILKALENCVIYNKDNSKKTITTIELYELGIIGKNNSKEIREKIDKVYHTGHSNGKALLKKLNCLNVERKELEKLINA